MSNVTKEFFKPLFENKLSLLANSTCQDCDATYKNPLLPWVVGSRFQETDKRLVFVGKPHRGTPGDILESGILDPTDTVENELWDIGWPYWSYTREICERIYGPDARDFIAFTNIAKCSNSEGVDETSNSMMTNCLSTLQVVWREIEQLQAKTLVFYTHMLRPDLITNIPVAIPGSVREITPQSNYVPCGMKRLAWWEREFSAPWSDQVRLLVIGHPERKKRSDFVELVSNWISQ